MWANTCWGLFGIAITLAIAMIGLPPEYIWLQSWFIGGAVLTFAASLLCFSRPLWRRTPNPILLPAQLAVFEQIQQFFGGLDESGLRSLFDLPNMLRFNILLTRRDLQKNSFPTDLNTEMNSYFKDGQGRAVYRYASVTVTTSQIVNIEPLPGKIGFLNTSDKFIASRKILTDLLSSTVLPTKVRWALRDFDSIIEENLELMIDVLNERFSHNPLEFIFAEDRQSPHYGRIVGEYVIRFRLLSPRANNIRQAIRDYLGIK
jgi:hypothetical protein